ncbi:unnamed protein product [Lampetra fluviatilis]
MSLGRRLRPTSATARLQTHTASSVFEERRPATAFAAAGNRREQPSARHDPVRPSRTQSAFAGALVATVPGRVVTAHGQGGPGATGDARPRRSETAPGPRRHSVSTAWDAARCQRPLLRRDLSMARIEESVTLEHLEKLKTAFEEETHAGAAAAAGGALGLEGFTAALKGALGPRGTNEEQILELFKKIDFAADGAIEWEAFCTHMQLRCAERQEAAQRARRVSLRVPAPCRPSPHRAPVARVESAPDGTAGFVSACGAGSVAFWATAAGAPQLKRCRPTLEEHKPSNRSKQKWASDFALMPQYNKFIIATGDREIQLYEVSTFEPYCQINALETVPLRINYSHTGEDECMILYGDSEGCVNILLISSVGETLRLWKKNPPVDGVPSITLENALHHSNLTYIHWKVHDDWVTELKYYESIRAVISSSNHEGTALVIGCTTGATNLEEELVRDTAGNLRARRPCGLGAARRRAATDQTVFRVHKGVKTFCFSKERSLVVTGGMDRTVRLWNPYVPGRPTGVLRGHTSPICYLSICEETSRIFSVGSDRNIKVWDAQEQTCLCSVSPKMSGLRGDVSACHYLPAARALCVATEGGVALLSVRDRLHMDAGAATSHREPVRCCRYSAEFRQVVSCSEDSVVKLWDLDSGLPTFEFCGAHGESAITCMAFDSSGRRLITGGRDGCLKVWNYNNGQCLRTLRKQRNAEEICDCTYVVVNKNKYIISVGWDKRINIFLDSQEDQQLIQFPQPHWADDLRKGHREDVLCVAQCPPSLLATSSYDGEVIVWNLVSGHVSCRLPPPPAQHSADPAEDDDLSVSKVIFLKSRVAHKDRAALLVASGPHGFIHFWNVYHGGRLFARFPTGRQGRPVCCLASALGDSVLLAADQTGHVYAWDVSSHAMHGPEEEPPQLVSLWRAHVGAITSMEAIEEHKLLLTAALDCSVRLWSVDGAFVGTFGQDTLWDIHNRATWSHPMGPLEILVDPLDPLASDRYEPSGPGTRGPERTNRRERSVERPANRNGPEEGEAERRDHVVQSEPTRTGNATETNELAPEKFWSKRLWHTRASRQGKAEEGARGPGPFGSLACHQLDHTAAPPPQGKHIPSVSTRQKR